jgi:hypothetical protein
MSHTETIEQELRQFLEDSQNLSRQDKYTQLKAIFDKHFAMEKVDHMLTGGDFHDIVSYAKGQFAHLTLPVKLGKKELYPTDVPHVMMIEAVISYLNKNKLLKRLVKLDYQR